MLPERLNAGRKTKLTVRICAVALLVMSSMYVGSAYLNRHDTVPGPTADTEVGDVVADPRPSTTVITTQGLTPSVEAPRAAISEPNGVLIAIGPTGEVVYKNDTFHSYWDVDPVPGTRATVMYVAGEYVPQEECGTNTFCHVRHVQVANLTTGEVKEIYTDPSPAGRWHDVDRYDNDSLLVADIVDDRIFIVNTTSGLVEWEWEAESAFPPSSGGAFDGDWTHINDVELLPDGRIMASIRNQDAVVFLDPETGIQRNWTLGEDDNYDVLKEQHNPDYIPERRGGPAVVVADSGNDRIVEYQRENGAWRQSWVWQDDELNWARDADRLPDGHTLVTDSLGDRVIEVNEEGKVEWTVRVERPYEAERFGTGDESSGGRSATVLGLQSRLPADDDEGSQSIRDMLTFFIPDIVISAVVFVLPRWVSFYHAGAILVSIGVVLVWLPLEYYWSTVQIELQRPIRIRRK